MTTVDDGVVGKRRKRLVEGFVHLLCRALEEATAAANEESVAAETNDGVSPAFTRNSLDSLERSPCKDTLLGAVLLVLNEEADGVLCMARRRVAGDLDVAAFEERERVAV